TTTPVAHGDSASRRQSSGPMPAGSPAVTASGRVIAGRESRLPRRSRADVDVGFVPQPPHPELGFLGELAVADPLDAVLFLEVLGVVVSALVLDLEDVPAEAALERLRNLAD